MQRRGRAYALLGGAVALLSACDALRGSHPLAFNDDATIAITSAAKRHTYTANYVRFAPASVRLRAGDAIRFENRSPGEPHVVAFGSLVDEAVRAATALGDARSPAKVVALPEVQRLPVPFDMSKPGQPVAFDPAIAEPCYVKRTEATTAALGPCTSAKLPDFDGDALLHSSGLLEPGDIYTVRLSPELAPGDYGFIDLAHREIAYGRLTVVAPDGERPRPGEVAERAADIFEASRQALLGAAPTASTTTAARGVAGIASGAGFDHLLTFGDNPYRVAVGGTVTWRLFGMHSISFAPTAEARRGLTVERDGIRSINAAAWEPTAPLQVSTPPSPDGTSTTEVRLDGGAWDGAGTWSSGVIRSYPPVQASYSLTFTKPGEFRFTCLVHPRMSGAVIVGGPADNSN